jgi:putative oxidoreductase
MAVAYFWQHQSDALLPRANHGIDAVMLCFAFLLLVFTGPGTYAFDSLRRRRAPARASA